MALQRVPNKKSNSWLKNMENQPKETVCTQNCGAKSSNPSSTSAVEPQHYKQHPSGTECIQVAEHFNFNLGNVVKYVWRAGLKYETQREDLEKAAWYLRREIARISTTTTTK
jgi:hypothetical protein